MFHTSEYAFGLRTISLLGGEILILKAIPISDKTARYVKSQEMAVDHTLDQFGVYYTHKKMYSIKTHTGFIEAVYRRKY